MCRHFLWFPAVAVLSLVLDVNSGAGFAAGQDGHPAFLLIKSITNPLPVHQLAFTKSSTSLVCFCNGEGFEQFGTAYVWDVHSAEQKARVKPYPPYYFVTVPYARLCFWEDNGIAILDEFIEREKRSVQLRDFGPAVNMGQVCFSGDGEYLAGVEMGTANLTLWELASGKRVARMNFPRDYVKGLRAIAIDPQHSYVAVGVDRAHEGGAVLVWEIQTGRQVLHSTESNRVFQVYFLTSGDLMWGGGDAQLENGTIAVLHSPRFATVRASKLHSAVTAIVGIKNTLVAVGGWNGEVRLWDVENGREVAKAGEIGHHTVALAINANRDVLAAGDWDATARVWKVVPSPK